MYKTDKQVMPNDQSQLSSGWFPSSRNQALAMCVAEYLKNSPVNALSKPKVIAEEIIQLVTHEFRLYNETAPKHRKMEIPKDLMPNMIAQIMLHMYHIKKINFAGVNSKEEYDLLGIYQEDGPDKGIYIFKEKELKRKIRAFNTELSIKEIDNTIEILRIGAPRSERCSDRDLIAVNNGIFNYKTKIVEPFDPDIVFTAKCRVNYNPAAQNITIHNDEDNTDWDVENWMKELFDDGETAECIWQIIGAIIRPNVRWRKSAWFVSEKGNNGKGTLCSLMRNLVGNKSYAAIQLSDFGKDFMLEPLIQSTAIITDENDVGTFIDKAANLKAIITNDVIQINRKFKQPINFRFCGFMVQCVNEMPRTKDKSESLYRRQIFIPFTKCYTGIERKYIKDDYLNREDVLEYVLYRVLNMDYYEITEPESCKAALNDYKTFNDPVRDFLLKMTEQATWGFYPSKLLFDMYKGWSKKNNPNGSVQGRNTFLNDVKNLDDILGDDWEYTDTPRRVGNAMECDEPLLDEYNCTDWMINPNSKNRRDRINTDKAVVMARGLYRKNYNPPTYPIDPDINLDI